MSDGAIAPFWDARYAVDDYVFGTAPNAFLATHATAIPASSEVLAVADGEGRNGVWLAAQGHRVHAVDGSPVALQKSARLATARSVSLQHSHVDLLDWDWPEAAYDAVVAIFIQFAGPAGRAAQFAGMRRALRPGGVLLLQGYTPRQLDYRTGGPSAAENLYTEAILRDGFGDWHWAHFAEHDSVIEEGPGHAGLSALIDLVAYKPGSVAG
jgi:cyclopropane fatty-acyl-phospholipid synthase-like methyltransferase